MTSLAPMVEPPPICRPVADRSGAGPPAPALVPPPDVPAGAVSVVETGREVPPPRGASTAIGVATEGPPGRGAFAGGLTAGGRLTTDPRDACTPRASSRPGSLMGATSAPPARIAATR